MLFIGGRKVRKFIGTLLALAVAAATQSAANADHNYGPYGNNTQSRYSEQNYHSDLAHRSNDRQSYHDQAHSLSLDNRQHNTLHQSMSHDAFHDNQDHSRFDANSSDRAYGTGYGTQSFGAGYPSRTQYNIRPYSMNRNYGNEFSTTPYSTRPYSGSQYSATPYSNSPYSMPRDMRFGNGSFSTNPRW